MTKISGRELHSQVSDMCEAGPRVEKGQHNRLSFLIFLAAGWAWQCGKPKPNKSTISRLSGNGWYKPPKCELDSWAMGLHPPNPPHSPPWTGRLGPMHGEQANVFKQIDHDRVNRWCWTRGHVHLSSIHPSIFTEKRHTFWWLGFTDWAGAATLPTPGDASNGTGWQTWQTGGEWPALVKTANNTSTILYLILRTGAACCPESSNGVCALSFNMLKHLHRASVLRFPKRRTLNTKP